MPADGWNTFLQKPGNMGMPGLLANGQGKRYSVRGSTETTATVGRDNAGNKENPPCARKIPRSASSLARMRCPLRPVGAALLR
jgi:hypothetical protein